MILVFLRCPTCACIYEGASGVARRVMGERLFLLMTFPIGSCPFVHLS